MGLLIFFNAFAEEGPSSQSPLSAASAPINRFIGKKILWVSSYHRGYEANDDIESGIKAELHNSGVLLHCVFMDTKRHDSPEFGEAAALKVLDEIKDFHPDVIIASDDNAQRYLVEPYLKNGSIPVVFCGVNWDAAQYGYPAPNVTGMVEVDLTREMFSLMKRHAAGERIGYLSGNVETERHVAEIYNKRFFQNKMKSYLVNSMAEFKEKFIEAQRENDMLYFYNYPGINDWDPVEAELFISRHIRKPLGSHNGFMSRFVVFVVAKSLQEHGRYAAQTAMRILDGVSPNDIALTENQQAELYINLRMAKAASIVLPVSLLRTATAVGKMEAHLDPGPEFYQPGKYAGKKILWVDSYNKGYEWSDGVERGIQNILYGTGVELAIERMNSLEEKDAADKRNAALMLVEKIRRFKPDIIIASDDNAQEYLVVPHLLNTTTPVVFCGINRPPEYYGYPRSNITGMVEVQPVLDLQRYLKHYAQGERVGFFSGDVLIQRELARHYNEQFFAGNLQTFFVKDMDDFKRQFMAAQQEVDMLIFSNYSGIKGWNENEAVKFIEGNNTIPTGTYMSYMEPYVIFSVGKLAEEQGYFAAKTALKVLDGTRPSDIPIENNQLSELVINIDQANAAELVLPYRLLRSAKVIGKRDKNQISR